ncbi:hypothetical protein H4R35_007117 [Dimargaris xerosporica]|nr:hypothetical protein H4R35_007117 [Dimargaris xerosporica]
MVDNISLANGLLTGAFAIGLLFGAPLAGWLSDRYHNRQIPMCIGLFSLLVATLIFGVCNAYWQLILARILQGAASGASWSVGFSMVADVYPPERAGMAMGTVMGCNTLGHLAGPTVGGLLFEAGGRHAPFIFGAALAFMDLLFRIIVGETYYWKRLYAQYQKDPEQFQECELTPMSTRRMLSHWSVVAALLGSFGVASVMSGVDPILPLHLHSRYGLSSGKVGLVFMAMIIPNAIVSPLVGWFIDRFQPNRLLIMTLGLLLVGAMSPIIAIDQALGAHVVTLVLLGTTLALSISPITPELLVFMHESGSNSYGVVYALFNIAFSIGMFVGPVIAGALYDVMGFLPTMLVMLAVVVSLALLVGSVEMVKIYKRKRKPVYTAKCQEEAAASDSEETLE